MSRRNVFIFLAAIFIITYLYTKMRGINIKQHGRFVNNIQTLKELNAMMNENILKSRFGILTYYDPLVQKVLEMKKISQELKDRYTDIPWKKISGTRDRIVHDYFGVDYEIIWVVVEKELEVLKREVSKILKEIGN